MYDIEACIKERPQGYALHIDHLTVRTGDTIALTGESGCGKSTTLDLLGLVLAPSSAARFTLTTDATYDIPALFREGRFDELARIRLASIGYVLQTGELLPYLTVLENMLVPARMLGLSLDEAAEEAHTVAKRLGIAHKLRAYPETLSVGERQRVAIVRALVPKPPLILADEPTAALDPLHASRVMDAFLEAVYERGTTLIVVTHNVAWVAQSPLTEVHFTLEQTGEGITAHVSDR